MSSLSRTILAASAFCSILSASTYVVSNSHTSTLISFPTGAVIATQVAAGDLTMDAAGNFITAGSPVLEKITPSGVVSTIATASSGQWISVAVDASGNYIVADDSNHAIWRISPNGSNITQVAKYPICSAGELEDVKVRVNAAGNYVVMHDNCATVNAYIVTPAGSISQLTLSSPIPRDVGGLTLDSSGNYVLATSSGLYSITPSGTVTTIAAGNPLFSGLLTALAYDASANVLVACNQNSNSLLTVSPSGDVTLLSTGAPISYPQGVVVLPGSPSLSAPGIETVISASSFGAFPATAPGSWIEIYGSNFSAAAPQIWTSASFTNNTAPTALGGVQVNIGGQKAYVEYVSATQINAQVPSISPGASQVTVSTSAGTSQPFNITVNPTEPGMLAPASFKIGGKQYVVAQFADGTYVLPPGSIAGVTSRQAKPGETIVIYGIGFGPVTPSLAAGQIEQAQNQLASPLQIMFGSTSAHLSYFGLAPGAVGLYQFNVVVPPIADSNLVPLTFTLAGSSGAQTLYTAVLQ
jgi:uncharacterized protein (TIGR03437 family)